MHDGWRMHPSRAEQVAAMLACGLAGFTVGVLACVLIARGTHG